jgi:hypothetical protein
MEIPSLNSSDLAGVADSVKGYAANATSAIEAGKNALSTITGQSASGLNEVNTGNESNFKDWFNPVYGSVLGRPLFINRRADPGNRVFNKTMIENNTIITVNPMIPISNNSEMKKMSDEIEAQKKDLSSDDASTRLNAALAIQEKFADNRYTMNIIKLESDQNAFKKQLGVIISQIGFELFKKDGTADKDINSVFDVSSVFGDAGKDVAKADIVGNGFKMWVDKATSISESVSNDYSTSMFESAVNKLSDLSLQMQYLGVAAGVVNGSVGADKDFSAENTKAGDIAATTAGFINQLTSAASGNKIILPSYWSSSKFNRSYDVSFRFVAPYGDKRTIFHTVLSPVAFLMTLAVPRGVPPNGMTFPYVLQIDAPGYFSTGSGVITNMSIKRGGDDSLFSVDGLPLIVEVNMTIGDLYSSLTVPADARGFYSNESFNEYVRMLTGRPLWYVPKMADNIKKWALNKVRFVDDMYSSLQTYKTDFLRYFGTGITENAAKATYDTVANVLNK